MKLEVVKLGEFTGHTGSIYALENGLEDHLFFSGSGDKFLTQWNVNTFEAASFTAKLPSIIYYLKNIVSKNLLLCGTSEGLIHVIDTKEKKEIKVLKNHSAPIFSINFSVKNNLIFTSAGDGKISVIDGNNLETKAIIEVSQTKVRSINFNDSETQMIIACGNHEIKIFSIPELSLLKTIEANKMATNIAVFHPNSKTVLSGGRDAILNVIDNENNSIISSIPAHNYAIYDILPLNDLDLFATASRDKTVKLWNSFNQNFELRINHENYLGHKLSVNKLLWLPKSQILLSAGDDRKIMAWKILKYQ
jgi:WD40 repeat protein